MDPQIRIGEDSLGLKRIDDNSADPEPDIIIDIFNEIFTTNYKKSKKNLAIAQRAIKKVGLSKIEKIIANEYERLRQGEYGAFNPNYAWILGQGLDECLQRLESPRPPYTKLSMEHEYDMDKLEKDIIAN